MKRKLTILSIALAAPLLLAGCETEPGVDEAALQEEVTALREDYDSLRTEFDTFQEEWGTFYEDWGVYREETAVGEDAVE